MASEKQIQANRLNGLKGGVKTPEGKAISRLNAITHGFFSNETLIPGEDEELLNGIRERFIEELKPVGELETMLVERVISNTWRLKRILQAERQFSKSYSLDEFGREVVTRFVDYRYKSWQNAMRYEVTLERQIYKAIKELERLQKTRLARVDISTGSIDVDSTGSIAPVSENTSPSNAGIF